MDIEMVDVTVHIDETLSNEQREDMENKLREEDGVISATIHDKTPHLMMIEYNPAKTNSQSILKQVKAQGVHAELVGI